MQKIYTEDLIRFTATVKKKVQTLQQSLVCVSVCLCLCVRVSVWWLTVKAIKHFWQKDYNVQQLQWSTRWQKAETKLSM